MIAARAESSGGQSRRPWPLWSRLTTALSRGTRILVLVVIIAAAGWAVWAKQVPHRAGEVIGAGLVGFTRTLGFRVDDVFVIGRKATSREKLLEAIAVGRGDPLFGVDLEETRRRVLALPWVRAVSVQRQLPDTLVVRLSERWPLAVWQHQGRFAVIDQEGETIVREDIRGFANLILLVGEDAPEHATALIEILATEPELRNRVKAAVRVGGRRWNLHMAGGVDVKLPETDVGKAWERLATYQRQHGLLDKNVRTVDMRLPDRLIVRRVQPPAEPAKPKGQKVERRASTDIEHSEHRMGKERA
jgi:cell division protein FtsQ